MFLPSDDLLDILYWRIGHRINHVVGGAVTCFGQNFFVSSKVELLPTTCQKAYLSSKLCALKQSKYVCSADN